MKDSSKLGENDFFSHQDDKGFSCFDYLDFSNKIFLFSGSFLGPDNRKKLYENKLSEVGGIYKDNNFSKDVDIFVCNFPEYKVNKKTKVDNYNKANPKNFIHTINQTHLDELIEKYKLNPSGSGFSPASVK